MPLAEARDAVSRLGGRLDESIRAAFATEYQLWAGEAERFAKARSVPGRDVPDLIPVALVFVLLVASVYLSISGQAATAGLESYQLDLERLGLT